MNFDIVKLNFHTPLHLSKGKPELNSSSEILHSDKIKSALFVSALQLFGDEMDKEGFWDSFFISSAFPYYKEEYFFPKPMAKLPLKVKDIVGDSKQSKQLKKIAYLGKSYFEKVLNGKEATDEEAIPRHHLLQKGAYLSDRFDAEGAKRIKVIVDEQGQRAAIPKMGETITEDGKEIPKPASPFYMERLYFEPDAGLYFLIEYKEMAIKEKIEAALLLLQDSGIGYHRNMGNGQFSYEFSTIDIDLPKDPNAWLSLSLFCPKREELADNLLDQSSYSLIKRGGWISSPENMDNIDKRKRSIYMFKEGGVFPFQEQEIGLLKKGKYVDLAPLDAAGASKAGHPIYRDGQALFLPIRVDMPQ